MVNNLEEFWFKASVDKKVLYFLGYAFSEFVMPKGDAIIMHDLNDNNYFNDLIVYDEKIPQSLDEAYRLINNADWKRLSSEVVNEGGV